MNRPETTLFLLVSVDGKISTGDTDELDVDKDYPQIPSVREGLNQYYELEKRTDLVSFNSGRVMAKIGVNTRVDEPSQLPVDFVVTDRDNHLEEAGIRYLCKKAKQLYVVVTNQDHPAHKLQEELANLEIIKYDIKINFADLFQRLKEQYGMEKMTVQTGGILNATLLRLGLIDHLSLVVAPVLIGGKDTSTLVDGESLHTTAELHNLKPLKLVKCEELEHSYLHLQYDVLSD